jgi:hypothetical protein
MERVTQGGSPGESTKNKGASSQETKEAQDPMVWQKELRLGHQTDTGSHPGSAGQCETSSWEGNLSETNFLILHPH